MTEEMVQMICDTFFWSVFVFCCAWIINVFFKSAAESNVNKNNSEIEKLTQKIFSEKKE